MPENLRDIKRRIKSVKNTQQITRAMKLVSGAKLRRAQMAVEAARPFAGRLRELVANIATHAGDKHPLLAEVQGEQKVELLVLCADRGLCGSFNSNILKGAHRFVESRDKAGEESHLNLFGRKAADYFRRREVPTLRQRTDQTGKIGVELARSLADELMDDFLQKKVDAVHVIYTEFRSAMSQTVRIERLLPIPRPTGESEIDYRFAPSPDAILGELLPRFVRNQVFQMLLESIASEHGARMTAMESATRNASEMIDHLTLRYNRARQASITSEILEIVSGAEALTS